MAMTMITLVHEREANLTTTVQDEGVALVKTDQVIIYQGMTIPKVLAVVKGGIKKTEVNRIQTEKGIKIMDLKL